MDITSRPATATHVPVKSLSPALRAALRKVSYHRADIAVQPAAAVSMWEPADDGRKGFALLVRLDTGEPKLIEGSWGNELPYGTASPVDLDRNAYPLPANGVVIKGSTGYRGTYATIYIPLAEAANFLPAPTVELTGDERNALYCVGTIKGGPYRRDELARRRVPTGVVDGLVARELLKRNVAGAVSITAAGRNALGDWNGF